MMIKVSVWSRQIVYSIITLLCSITILGVFNTLGEIPFTIFTVNTIQQVLLYVTFCVLSYDVWCDIMGETEAPKPYYDAHKCDKSIVLGRGFASIYILYITMLYSPIVLTFKLLLDLLILS